MPAGCMLRVQSQLARAMGSR